MKHQGYVEAILPYLQDKLVEIFTGSYAKTRKYYDFDHQQKEVIRGVVRGGAGDLLMVEIGDLGNTSNSNTNIVYINGWAITAIIEPKNSISIFDVYRDEHEKQEK